MENSNKNKKLNGMLDNKYAKKYPNQYSPKFFILSHIINRCNCFGNFFDKIKLKTDVKIVILIAFFNIKIKRSIP